MDEKSKDWEQFRRGIDEVFAAMGSALTRWSMADSALTVLYGVTVNPRKPKAGAASIWKITGVNQKLEIIDAALEAMYPDYPKSEPTQVRQEWNTAKKVVLKAARGRNELAHSSLHSSTKDTGRKSVLQRDRERFYHRIKGNFAAPSHDAKTCRRIELDALHAVIAVNKVLSALDLFFHQSRIRMNEADAHHEPPLL